jgi:hypothetical protein
MLKVTPKNPQIDKMFTGYVYTPGTAGLGVHATPQDFATAMADKAVQGLVIYAAPAQAIACILQDGAEPASALEQWDSLAQPYLALLRKMRRRLTLFQLPLDDNAPTLQTTLGERLPDIAASDIPDLPSSPTLSEPFWHALAMLHMTQDPAMMDVVDILQSHSTGNVETVTLHAATPVLFERWRAHEQQTQTRQQQVNAQNTLLVDQIVGLEQNLADIHDNLETVMHDQQAHVQELVTQIDTHGQMVQVLTAARETGRQALEAAVNQIKTHQTTQAGMQSRIDEKNKQIGTLTAERDAARVKQQTQQGEASTEKKRLESALEAARLTDANHQKTISVLTAERDAARVKQQTEEQKMSAALEAQTATVQISSENHQEMVTQMSGQISQLESAMRFNPPQQDGGGKETGKEALRQIVRQLEVSLSMFQSRQSKVQEQNDVLQAELTALHNSTSWRVTGPMRSVTRLVRR